MNRKEFLKLSSSIIGGLAIPGAFGDSASATETKARKGAALDDSYLAKGLTGMARAEGWFDAHWGAGVLAGYYLCTENHLNEQTIAGIKKQLDAVIHLRATQFAPLPKESADETSIAEVPKALLPAITGGLRAHGHAVIFASLSTKALRDAPYLAQPTLIDALCGLSRQIGRKKLETPEGKTAAKPYADAQAMIEATFDSLVRFKGLLGRPSIRRPNFTHMTTHTEALMSLEKMGYPDLAKAGYAGHRVHIGAPVPEIPPTAGVSADRASLEAVMSESYWNDKQNQDRWNQKWNSTDNRNGDWIASGHLFKVLYSYHRLIGRIKDTEKVKLCSKILLERYMNPEVQGG
ncbi:MAG: hypothetical protein IIA65_00730 [Planctomycetes bacterium]|nr:hypothetical protein [Planctomycetota bacterium]